MAPITQLTQHGINNSSILISWNASDCAVQYVVTINSSDDSVYYTSDTNTTVTELSNGVEFCVTVVAVDGIGRKGPDSIPLCHGKYKFKLLCSANILYQKYYLLPQHPLLMSLPV